MTGCIQGTIGAGYITLKKCTSVQISLGCCTSTTSCGILGIGVPCYPASGTFTPANC